MLPHSKAIQTTLALATLLLVLPARAGLDAGPLCDEFPLTLSPGERTEVAGPLFYSELADTQQQWSLPPLFSHTFDPAADLEEDDFLYPLVTYDRYGSEYRFQILQLFSFAGSRNQADQDSKRFSLFPLYLQQRSQDPSKNYTAVFPIYGHVYNRFVIRDEAKWILFPAYLQTRKGAVVTDNYVFPFFHLRHGPTVDGWQFWPLLGHEVKTPSTKTDNWGDTDLVPGHDKWFALWPFFFNQYTQLGTTNEGHEVSVLPAYSQFRSPGRDSTSVLWPFFNVIDDREKQYREWELPYPFIVFARGPGKTTDRVWPFFGTSHNKELSSEFYLWPVYKHNLLRNQEQERERTRILFFLWSDIRQQNLATGSTRGRTDLWPLFQRHVDFNGDTRLQVLAPIESFLPDNKSLARDWSPLWSLWRAEEQARTGAHSESLLWNLYRRQRTADGAEKVSLAFGLLRYQSGVTGEKWRVLFVPLGKAEPPANYMPVPEPERPAQPPILHPRYDLLPAPAPAK